MNAKLFKNKYRIPSARLKNWDYGSNGIYFITICTGNHECYFGKIENAAMVLNTIGRLAHDYWLAIPQHFPFVELGHFVVMPNHVHGILIVDKLESNVLIETPVETRFIASDKMQNAVGVKPALFAFNKSQSNIVNSIPQFIDSIKKQSNNTIETALVKAENTLLTGRDVGDVDTETRLIASLRAARGGITGDSNPMINQNISRIIRWYKGRCSFEIRKLHADFNWQSRFYDVIIRDTITHENIYRYIECNPANWEQDELYPSTK